MVILDSCPFTMNELKKIFTLMENSVCKIEIIEYGEKSKTVFTGFLLKFFFQHIKIFFFL